MLISHPHAFPPKEAKQRIEALTTYWSERYAMKGSWSARGYRIRGKSKGIRFDALFQLAERRVDVQVEVPFFARPIGRDYVQRKLRMYLDPAASLAELQALAR